MIKNIASVIGLAILCALLQFSSSAKAAGDPRSAPGNTIKEEVLNYSIPMEFRDDSEWQPIIMHLLNKNFRNVHYYFHSIGTGGDGFLARKVTAAVQESQARGNIIDFIIAGPAISAHAYLACYGDHVYFKSGGSLTFHGGGEYTFLFNLPILKKSYATDPEANLISREFYRQCIKSGLLTEEDISRMEQGQRIIVYQEEGKNTLSRIYTSDWGSIYEIPWQIIGWAVYLLVMAIIGKILYVFIVNKK